MSAATSTTTPAAAAAATATTTTAATTEQQQQQQQSRLTNKQFLKQLEKSWKPFPPWCVSTKRVPEDFSEELSLFSNLLSPTSSETSTIEKLQSTLQETLSSSSSSTKTTIHPASVTAAGFSLVEGPLFFSCCGTSSSSATRQSLVDSLLETGLFEKPLTAEEEEEQRIELEKTGAKKPLPAVCIRDEEGEDNNNSTGFSIRLREAPSTTKISRSIILFFGSAATRAQQMGDCLKAGFSSTNAKSSLAAWHVLLSSLKQTRNLDDNEPTALSSDAAATMMLSVANSYDAPPTPSQALTDFFLLYGFTTSFDMALKSITIKGALVDVPKVHTSAAISVIDPLTKVNVESLSPSSNNQNQVRNLTAGMTTAAVNRLINIFAYCYRVIAEYSRGVAEQERGRAESTLSTFLGGGPYWTRVIVLAEQGCEPYPEILVNTNNGNSNSNNGKGNGNNNNGNKKNNNNNSNNTNNGAQRYYNNNNNNGGRGGRGGNNYRGNNNNNRGGYNNNNNNGRGGQRQYHQGNNNGSNNNNNGQQVILLPTPNSHQQPPTYDFSINAPAQQ